MGGGSTKKVLKETANVLTNVSTGGTLGFEDGGLTMGEATEEAVDVVKEPLKEVTGAAAAEEQLRMAAEARKEEARMREQLLEEQRAQQRGRAVSASRRAGRGRSTGGSTSGQGTALNSSQDKLGL